MELPKYVIPVLGLCLGYPDEDPGLKPRLPKEAIYFEERYNPDLENLLERYDNTYAEYLKVRPFNNRVGNWSELVRDFYRQPFHYEETAQMLRRQRLFTEE